MRLEDLRKNLRHVVVEVNIGQNEVGEEQTEKLIFTYRPSELTPDMTRRLGASLESEWKAEWSLKYLVALLVEWDLLDGDEPYPITLESLAVLPDYFLGQVIAALTEDMGKAREGLVPS